MIAVPAVDLRGGRCVQLVGGEPGSERVSLPDPVKVARSWWEKGFAHLHVVDLDAAIDESPQHELVRTVIQASAAEVQVGGGVRDGATADTLLGSGAARVVVGTRAVDDRPWLEALVADRPGQVMVAADIQDGIVLRKGWQQSAGLDVTDFVRSLADLDLAGILCTDVGREGRVEGIDPAGVVAVLEASPHPVWISGGVSTVDDLAFLDDHGAAGAVLGMALYTEALDAAEVAAAWGGR